MHVLIRMHTRAIQGVSANDRINNSWLYMLKQSSDQCRLFKDGAGRLIVDLCQVVSDGKAQRFSWPKGTSHESIEM